MSLCLLCRVSVEQQIAELHSKMEEVVTARAVEEQEFKQLLHEQRQTAEDCSEKVKKGLIIANASDVTVAHFLVCCSWLWYRRTLI